MIPKANRRIARVAIAAVGGLLAVAAPAGAAGDVTFAPHRAVYDITLARAAPGSGVSDMTGRLVYELTGGACEGYTQSMRFVTQSNTSDGSEQINDMRSSSFEDVDARRLQFTTTQYRDDQSPEVTQGKAGRSAGGALDIELSKPEQRALSFPATTYFPIQHSIALLQAARAGKARFEADVYDGSEKGDKVSATATVIGKGRTGQAQDLPADVKAAQQLRSMRYWPISTSYFEKDKGFDKKDSLPNYELAAHFYENGVSTRLMMDYGDFMLKGELKELEFLKAPACAKAE